MQDILVVLTDAAKLWYRHGADAMSAVVSYYMLFAIAPLLLITVTMTGVLYGSDFVVATLLQWGKVLGPEMLTLLTNSVKNLQVITDGYTVPVIGAIFFSGMVIAMFNAFTNGLHTLWGETQYTLMAWFQKSMRSILFIVIFEFYLMCLIAINTTIGAVTNYSPNLLFVLLQSTFFLFSTAFLFSIAFKILPVRSPDLSARFIGGMVASFLLLFAKSFVTMYLQTTPVPGIFGTAGLLLVFLIWVYISTAFVYYGACVAYILELRHEHLREVHEVNGVA